MKKTMGNSNSVSIYKNSKHGVLSTDRKSLYQYLSCIFDCHSPIMIATTQEEMEESKEGEG